MRIQTFTVVAGNARCNARCPYCVSKMTPDVGVSKESPSINVRNFNIAKQLAKDSGVSTMLITGKGEPTLYPANISMYLELAKNYFPLMELQTNGINIFNGSADYDLKYWYDLGLTTIAVSAVHWLQEKNKEIFGPQAPDLAPLVDKIHSHGFSVRLSITMLKDYVDCPRSLMEQGGLINFCKAIGVEQLTVRPIARPQDSADVKVAKYVNDHMLSEDDILSIRGALNTCGTKLLELPHGATVYDFNGQNICLSNCLTLSSTDEQIRQLIFFPDGQLRYDWQYEGARLL